MVAERIATSIRVTEYDFVGLSAFAALRKVRNWHISEELRTASDGG
jgi:hypothetical protein